MQIIYCSGNSIDNKNWIETVKSKFDEFSTGNILYYDHWDNGNEWIDLKLELETLRKLVEGKTDYIVFAKSIGTILTLKSISEGFFYPKSAVFCGLPYSSAKHENVDINNCLRNLTIPTVFIHNEFDKVGSARDLEEILKANSPADYKLIIKTGNITHKYEDYEELVNVTKDLISKIK